MVSYPGERWLSHHLHLPYLTDECQVVSHVNCTHGCNCSWTGWSCRKFGPVPPLSLANLASGEHRLLQHGLHEQFGVTRGTALHAFAGSDGARRWEPEPRGVAQLELGCGVAQREQSFKSEGFSMAAAWSLPGVPAEQVLAVRHGVQVCASGRQRWSPKRPCHGLLRQYKGQFFAQI